jgi:hypothetical protein
MLKSTLPDKLPDGVCEVIPGALYVGSAQAARAMILDWNVRCVVRCMEEAHDYQQILDDVWVAECEARFEDERAKKASSLETSRCEGCDDAADNKPTETIVEEAGDRDAVDLDETIDHSPDNGSPSTVAAVVEEVPPPTRDEWLHHRPASHEVRTFHCPLEDTMTFSLMDFEPFMAALRFIDDAMLQRGAAFGDWEEKPTDAEPSGDDGHQEGVEGPTDAATPAGVDTPQPAIYVHCLAGRSRSPALVLAYLMTRKQVTLQEALDMLAPQMRPNPNFIQQLMGMENELRLCDVDDVSLGLRGPSFDLRAYFVDGLSQMHPAIPEDVVEQCLDACGGSVEAARMLLTKKAFELAKEKASIDSLLAVINDGVGAETPMHFTSSEVRDVFVASEKNRTVALRRLLEVQKERQQLHEKDDDQAASISPPHYSKSAATHHQ